MAALPLLKYALRELYSFPWYATRADYKAATGQDAPPFDTTRQPKYWFDPEAEKSVKRVVSYDRVIAVDDRGNFLPGNDGKPYTEILLLPKAEAATVNIPMGLTNEPGAGEPPVMCPLRPIEPEEELYFELGGVLVRNKSITDTSIVGFSAEDRAILRAMARKLNVSVS